MTQESISPGRYRWYVVVLLMAIYACQTMDRQLLNMMFEPIKHEFGLSDNQLGMLAGLAFALPNAIMAIPFGMLVDRVNRTRLLAFAASIWSLLTLSSGFAGSYWGLLAARAGLGTMEAVCPPAAASLTADYFPPRQRSAGTSAYMAGVSVGLLAAFALGGIIATHYGWRTVFFVASVPGLLISLLVVMTVREPQRGSTSETPVDAPSLRTTLSFIKSQKTLVHLIIAMILLTFGQTTTTVWTTSYLMRFHGMPIRDAGIVLAIGLGVIAFFGTAAAGLTADRMGKINPRWQIRVPIIAVLVSTTLWCAMLLTTEKSGAIALLWTWAFFNVGWIGPVYGLIVRVVEPRMRGTTMALAYLLSNGIGSSAGPQVIGIISDQLSAFVGNESLRYALFAPVLINLWGAWHCFVASRSIETDLRRVERVAA